MMFVLELAGVLALLVVVWVLFRAARARPDERGLRYAAWGALVAWVIFAIWSLVDFAYVRENLGSVGQNAVIVGIVLVIIFGYRAMLARLRDQAQDR